MSQRSTKLSGQKVTAVRKASGVTKGSKAAQKQSVPKDTARPARSGRHVSLVTIPLTVHNICANSLFPSPIQPAAMRNLILVLQMSRTTPYRRAINLSNMTYSTPLLLSVPRTHRSLESLKNLAERPSTSIFFSPHVKLRAKRCECATSAHKSSVIHEETSTK